MGQVFDARHLSEISKMMIHNVKGKYPILDDEDIFIYIKELRLRENVMFISGIKINDDKELLQKVKEYFEKTFLIEDNNMFKICQCYKADDITLYFSVIDVESRQNIGTVDYHLRRKNKIKIIGQIFEKWVDMWN
jgi:hypothetical protein